MELELCNHCPVSELDEEKLTEIFRNYKSVKCSHPVHEDLEKPMGEPNECWTCLKCYETFCGRSVDTQCMLKHWEEKGNEHCVVVSLSKKMTWYYY